MHRVDYDYGDRSAIFSGVSAEESAEAFAKALRSQGDETAVVREVVTHDVSPEEAAQVHTVYSYVLPNQESIVNLVSIFGEGASPVPTDEPTETVLTFVDTIGGRSACDLRDPVSVWETPYGSTFIVGTDREKVKEAYVGLFRLQ